MYVGSSEPIIEAIAYLKILVGGGVFSIDNQL
jgi:hypothetical protein